MQEIQVISARIMGKSLRNSNELYAVTTQGRYFVQRDSRDPDSSDCFDYIMNRAKKRHFSVPIRVYPGHRAVIAPPQDFLNLYRERALYLFHLDAKLQDRSGKFKKLMRKQSQFLEYSVIWLSGNNLQIDFGEFRTGRYFDWNPDSIIKILEEDFSGELPRGYDKFRRQIHAIAIQTANMSKKYTSEIEALTKKSGDRLIEVSSE